MHGFVHERRVSGERGLWVTHQLFSNVPLSDADALAVWREVGVGAGASPSAHFPTVGEPGPRTVGRQLPVEEEREKSSSRPPTEAPAESVTLEALPPQEAEAERVLLSLRHVSRELHLGVLEARGLVAQAVEWLRRGVSVGELRRVLSSDLPEGGVRSAVGFLGHRLMQKMPEAPQGQRRAPVAPAAVEEEAPPPVPPYVAPLVTCQGPGTEHVFRSMAGETECPDCQQAAAWARWAERRAADLGVDLAEEAAAAVEAGRSPDGWRARLAAAAASGASGGQ